jgi:AbrB family looped-hinge helix DNA binding protein
MTMQSTVTRKGQVTVPVQIRSALNIKQGDRLSFVLEGDHVRVERLESVTERTAGIFRGCAPTLSAEELRVAAELAIAEDVRDRATR